MPVIFVHGVTVRKDRFERLLETVRDGLTGERNDLSVEGYFWGDEASSLRFGGASIPGFLEGARAIGEAKISQDERSQLMALLLDDPYLELRVLKDTQEFDPAGAGFTPLPQGVDIRNQALYGNRTAVANALKSNASLQSPSIRKATDQEIQQMVATAFDHAGRADRQLTLPELLDPLSRCLTAAFYQSAVRSASSLDTDFDWTQVEKEIQQILEKELGGQRSWIGDRIKNATLSTVTFAMRHGVRRRMMESMSLFIGDVLVYMSKRGDIMKKIEAAVASAMQNSNTPLWLVGHSLGGIICFDYCCETSRDVERLVTVGSQVGLFGELGALNVTLDNNQKKFETPAKVKQWLNVYDPNDMLSFIANPIFTRVTDKEFDTQAPFPVSHSEYWNRSELYPVLLK